MRRLTEEQARDLLGLPPDSDLLSAAWVGGLDDWHGPTDAAIVEVELTFTGIGVAAHADGRLVGTVTDDALPTVMPIFVAQGGRARIPAVVLVHERQVIVGAPGGI